MLELLHDMNPAEMRYQRGSFSSIQGIAAVASSTPTVKDKDKCKLQLKFVLYTRAIFSDVLQAKNTRKGKKKNIVLDKHLRRRRRRRSGAVQYTLEP